MLTVFTSPKPFAGHIGTIQRNAIGSWLALAPDIQVIVIGDEDGVAPVAREMGVVHIPEVERNDLGTPLVSSIMALARERADHPLMCFVNADIMFLDDFLPSTARVASRFDKFLIVGQRWDLRVDENLDFSTDWRKNLRLRLKTNGRLHPAVGSDYFVFARDQFPSVPPFALGRAGWDNWMIFAGRSMHVPVVDASQAITAIHQAHDYSHLPGGQPHHRLPESKANLLLAGGRLAIFTLKDASWREDRDHLRRITPADVGIAPWLASGATALFGTGPLGIMVGHVLHPVQTSRRVTAGLRRRARRLLNGGQPPALGKKE